jgi:hypothetical protein
MANGSFLVATGRPRAQLPTGFIGSQVQQLLLRALPVAGTVRCVDRAWLAHGGPRGSDLLRGFGGGFFFFPCAREDAR